MKTLRSQQGFSARGGLALILVVALLGGGTWYAINRQNNNSNTPTVTNSPDSRDTISRLDAFTMPADYISYTNSASKFSIAYPANWGGIATSSVKDTGFNLASQYLNNVPFGGAVLTGQLGINISKKDGFTINPRKYGPLVGASGSNGKYTWKVKDVFSANPETTKVGHAYKVSSLVNADHITIYDFGWADEGKTTARWLFESNGKFVTITLPSVWTPNSTGDPTATSSEDLATYQQLAKAIASSIKEQ